MVRLAAILAACGTIYAAKEPPPLPTEFYIVTQFLSDAIGESATYVLDVRPDGDDTVVHFVRIGQARPYCTTKSVKLVETRLKGMSPGVVLEKNNPCAVSQAEVQRAVQKFGRPVAIYESSQHGIVARCGSEQVSLRLPYAATVDLEKLKRNVPKVWRLWLLADEIRKAAFGREPFDNLSEDQDWQLQVAGQTIVPELLSGRFDRGFVGRSFNPANYHGPARPQPPTGRLLDKEQFRFTSFVEPGYPPLAKEARIEGRVELRLTVDSTTGEVTAVSVRTGHPVLTAPVAVTARKWRFVPGSTGEEVAVAIQFELNCP